MVRRRQPSRQYSCRVCAHEVAAQSVYEFCRAKEVFRTTNIPYAKFLAEYIEGVIGFPVGYQSFMAHIHNHVRPSLRREMRELEIEEARLDGKHWTPPKLEDFLVSEPDPHEKVDLSTQIEGDMGLEPVEDLDHTEHPEFADVPQKDWDPTDPEQCKKTNARFWRDSGDADSQTEDK
jgi:hypothetical protein